MGEPVEQPAYVEVALPVPVFSTFTYAVPPDLRAVVRPGVRVLVPFGRQTLTGVITGTSSSTAVRGIRPVQDVLDTVPTYPEELLKICSWVSTYYVAPLGETLRAAAPHGLSIENISRVTLSGTAEPQMRFGRSQQHVLDALTKAGTMTVRTLRQRTRLRSVVSVVRSLETKGLVSIEDGLKRPRASVKTVPLVRLSAAGRIAIEDPASGHLTTRTRPVFMKIAAAMHADNEWKLVADVAADAGVTVQTVIRYARKGLLEEDAQEVVRDPFSGPVEDPPQHRLTVHQETAVRSVRATVDEGTFGVFLLHGITGSGKTQVYIESLKRVREQKKGAIVLVPEISLTPQTVRRFRSHFGDDVVVMHSQLSAGERYDAWRRIHRGDASIVIGPRSAVFAPVRDLGLIVVDEEHEGSYKQYDASPRYHARDVAIVRARQNGAVVVLGSATPSIESYWNARSGKYRLLELPDRVDDARLPVIQLVDMIAERRNQFERIKAQVREKGGAFPKKLPPKSVSELLAQEIGERLQKKEGVILLHNRRGFAHVVECPECGYAERCDNCDVTMTYHMKTRDLHCHYCGVRRPLLTTCPSCRVGQLRHTSYGTQQVHEELMELFPDARIVRMDRDTTRRKGAFERFLRGFEEGHTDILLGTQMVAKGLDFPRVTLVGVISAETQLHLPDFRASERTFQLLTQVAGRAGRGKLVGEVVIQTVNPRHPTLLHAVKHDYASFYEAEMRSRMDVRYPPVVRIALVECSGRDERAVIRMAEQIGMRLREHKEGRSVEILGPAEPAIARIRNNYRQHILIKNDREKDPGASSLRAVLTAIRGPDGRRRSAASDVRVTVDIDPHTFL